MQLIALLICVSLPIWWADAASLNSFRQELKEFQPRASWICQRLMHLKVHDACTAFEESVAMLICPETRWAYFCDDRSRYSSDTYLFACLSECLYFNSWIEKTVVDTDGYLYSKTEEIRGKPLLEVWNVGESAHVCHMFYAFLIDCSTEYFTLCVSAAFNGVGTDEYKLYAQEAKKLFERIKQWLTYLKKSDLYTRYQFLLSKYREVLDVLMQDHFHALG